VWIVASGWNNLGLFLTRKDFHLSANYDKEVTMIKKGEKAPDFVLKGHDDREYNLSDYRGKNVVLVFYPLDFSPVCTKENECIVSDLPKFNAKNGQVFGVSVDSVWAHKAFARQIGATYPLLADFHPRGEVSKQFGLYLEDKGVTARAIVVIGGDGVVREVFNYDLPEQPDIARVINSL